MDLRPQLRRPRLRPVYTVLAMWLVTVASGVIGALALAVTMDQLSSPRIVEHAHSGANAMIAEPVINIATNVCEATFFTSTCTLQLSAQPLRWSTFMFDQ
jgi:hypothetical protein